MLKRLKNWRMSKLAQDTRGLTTVEYLIILSLVAILGLAAWETFGRTTANQVRDGDMTLRRLEMSSNASSLGGDS
jgi:Flp pilus assembly pilin Flp